ncbi:ABC transporter permease [Tsukamurella sp. 8F]|uniref:MlaE family ABC transporter permease n=1 Tax=unclassified Tsukamurella TaxID=2633480 RepID=UPI0023B95351|nr:MULTISPECIES: ABC transporter permease [unclassified Tsukamurella]MDF0530748.1 ABC transporter permease [Tsukamurella sp. 8J]MDF0587949.1 ABC transporter permease [Tsukamurella sp. 8F]
MVMYRGARVVTKSLSTIGRSVLLTRDVIVAIVTGVVRRDLALGEVVTQAVTLLRVTSLPAFLVAIPFGAVVSVQVGALVDQVGANSLVGAASGMGIIRQGAPLATGVLIGGVCASAIAADLGARSIREELDAMRVMGVDPVARLIAPRLLALILIAPMLLIAIVAVSMLIALAVALAKFGISAGGFWSSFGAFSNAADLVFAVLKAECGAVVVGLVAGLRGIEARGGPRGVADAVNSSVVLSIMLIFLSTLALTQVETMFFPSAVA